MSSTTATDERQPIAGDPWMEHMRRGELSAAWLISDRALAERTGVPCWHWPRHQQYIWDGQPLNGKRVLVRCYHGLGDTIQFIRYVPLLGRIAREVTVWVQPALIPLLENMQGIGRLLPLHDGVPEVEYEAEVELMELPHVFRSTLQTLPKEVPYLIVESAETRGELRPHDGGDGDRARATALNVGLVWRGGGWDQRRSVPEEMLEPLLNVKGVHWVLLQPDATVEAWEAKGFTGTLVGPHTILEAARIMRTLDLVISVDTLAAHLAGALAVPVWTLLPEEADWRWMEEREDSPWYPTMRLFRQQKDGEWREVIRRVVDALENGWMTETKGTRTGEVNR